MRMAVLALVVCLMLVGLTIVASRSRRYRRGAAAAVGALLVGRVRHTPANEALLRPWCDRAAWWRLSIALPTVALTILASVMLRSSLDVGIGAHPAWSDPLLMGLLGAFLGAVAAELHLLRRPVPQRRRAELEPRDLAEHLPPGSRRRLVVLGALAGLACVATPVVADGALPVLGLLGLAFTGLVPLVQRGIVGRGRPALGADLRGADQAVRRLAVYSVDQSGAAAILLLSAWQFAPVYTSVDVDPALEVGLVIAQIASLVLAVTWWRRSNPGRLLPDIPEGLGARAPAPARP